MAFEILTEEMALVLIAECREVWGRQWKQKLSLAWQTGNYRELVARAALLQQLRNGRLKARKLCIEREV